MRKRTFSIILSLCFIMLFTPSIIFTQEIACDIGVNVFDEEDSTAVEDVIVYCWSYDELEGKYQHTDAYGNTTFNLINWPNPPPCSNNYGDYAICLPYYWEEEDIYYEGGSGIVNFYIDPESPHQTAKCVLAGK